MRNSDLISGFVLFVLGMVTLLVIIPDQIGSSSFGGLPPDFFPRILARIFIVMTLVLLLTRGWAAWRSMPHTEPIVVPLGVKQAAFITGASVCLFVTFWLMANVSYIVAAIFIVATAAVAMGRPLKNPVRLVLTAVAGPVVIYLVFRNLFLIFLPA